MNKESLFIFTGAIVLSAGIVGGLYYFSLKELGQPTSAETMLPKQQVASGKGARQVSPPPVGRTDVIKKCTKPDGSEFWTNAAQCDAADLNNRMSRADPVKPISGQKNPSTSNRAGKAGKAGKAGESGKSGNSSASRSKNDSPKPIPQNMPVSCKFPIGMARKIERKSLSLKPDPADSIWKKSYCRWVCDAKTEGCENVDDYLEYTEICPSFWRFDQRSCGAT